MSEVPRAKLSGVALLLGACCLLSTGCGGAEHPAAAVPVAAGATTTRAGSSPAPGPSSAAPTPALVPPSSPAPQPVVGGPARQAVPAPAAPSGRSVPPSPALPAPASPGTGLVPDLPLDTKAYPPPEVARSAATTPGYQRYITALQQGGLTVSATGASELALGIAVCRGLGEHLSEAYMRENLLAAGSLGSALSKSALTGEQAVTLYMTAAKASLC